MNETSIPAEWQRALHELASERYELIEELGQGGMATVFRGRDAKLKRTVAIKILHRHLLRDHEHCARFRREAESIARLDHPGIIEIYDLLEEPGEFLAIVMEYIQGPSLDEFVTASAPIPPELAAQIALPILDALEHAHSLEIIHRDLKPENILFRDDMAPILMDFGIAYVADEKTLTRTGKVMGSPAFMTPEGIEDRAIDERTDLFSFGSILFLMVTGEPAFSGKSAPNLMRNIVAGRRPRADEANEIVGRRFARIIDLFLSVDPDDRPATCAGATEILENFIASTMGEDRENLKRWFENPSGSASEFSNRLTAELHRLAEHAIDDGDRRLALDVLERLLAMDSDDQQAKELLDRLHRATSLRRTGRIIFAVAILAAIAVSAAMLFEPADDTATDDVAVPSDLVESTARAQSEGAEAARNHIDSSVSRAFLEAAAIATARDILNTATESITATDESPPELPDTTDEVPAEPQDSPRPDADNAEEPVSTIRFRLIPASASLIVGDDELDAMEAAHGIDLTHGAYDLVARAPGSITHRETLQVGPDTDPDRAVVLHWKDGYIRLVVDRDALVWIDDEESPQSVSSGEEAVFTVDFGAADEDRNLKEVALRIADRDDLQRSQQKIVTVRPDTETPVAVSLNE